MDFMSALRYPFNSIAKVFSIVLALTIALVICLALIISAADWSAWISQVHEVVNQPEVWMSESHDMDADSLDLLVFPAGATLGLLLLLLVFVAGGFWMSGYSLSVVRAVMAGEERMPEFEHGKHLSDGFMLCIASIVYGIAGCVIFALFLVVASFGGLFALLGFVVMIGLFFVLGWSYYIGMARYAVGEGSGALFALVSNFSAARMNWRAGLALTGWSIALALVYKVGTSIVDAIIGGIAAGDIVLDFAIVIVVFFALNFLQHFSTQHLIAQYALAVGVGDSMPEKDKTDFDIK